MKCTFTIPDLPPPLNNMYFNVRGRGRVKSDRYRTWRSAMGWEIKRQHNRIIKFTGPVYIVIACQEPKRKCDLDGRIKGILDLLVDMQIIPDDSQKYVRGINIYFAPDPEFKGVEIAITALEWPAVDRSAAA